MTERVFSEEIRPRASNAPPWVDSERSGLGRRFYFENRAGYQWIASVGHDSTRVAGSSIDWAHFTFNEKDYRIWIHYYLRNPNTLPDGYSIPMGPPDNTLEESIYLNVNEARWVASVLGVGIEIYTMWKFPKSEEF